MIKACWNCRFYYTHSNYCTLCKHFDKWKKRECTYCLNNYISNDKEPCSSCYSYKSRPKFTLRLSPAWLKDIKSNERKTDNDY